MKKLFYSLLILVLSTQFFPKEPNSINFYDLTFDMKFREDYESDFDGVCIGPTWNENKPGEIKITLKKDNNFKTNINGKFYQNAIEDDCSKYIYYLRYFESTADSGEIIKYGVATDYAENYPDAPNYFELDDFESKSLDLLGIQENWLTDISLDNSHCSHY